MAKSTNELIAGFVFLAFRIWITATSDEKDQRLVGPAGRQRDCNSPNESIGGFSGFFSIKTKYLKSHTCSQNWDLIKFYTWQFNVVIEMKFMVKDKIYCRGKKHVVQYFF